MRSTDRLRSSARELAVLVAGILIAFSLDAWWDEAREEAQAAAQLVELRRQVDGDLEHLAVLRADVEAIAADLDSLASLLPDQAAGVVIPDLLLGASIRWRTSDVSTRGFDAFVESGYLRTVDDLDLRRMISSFGVVLDDLQEDERLAQNYVETVFGPFLAEHGMGRVAFENRTRATASAGSSEVRVPASFAGMVAARRTHLAFILSTMDGLDQFLAEMGERIDAELAG